MKLNVRTVFFNVAILAVLLLVLEIGVRYFITYNPGYYTGIRTNAACVQYPYGEVCLNSRGFPDDEFNVASSKPRVGYFGDSICYGVGAGRGYRITDLLKAHYDKFEHYNFCYIGDSVLSDVTLRHIRVIARQYQLAHVVYLMNLNDIPPLLAEMEAVRAREQGQITGEVNGRKLDNGTRHWVVDIKKFLVPFDEFLRGKSYLYTYARNKIKERLTVAGFEASGYKAVELAPEENSQVFTYAADKVNDFHRYLHAKDATLTLVLLPYEMQVSTHAADNYRRRNISWEPGFESGSAQAAIVSKLERGVRYFDALSAFAGRRATAMTGEYFVYDQGDKIDWNHPNREGHRLIAEYLIKERILP